MIFSLFGRGRLFEGKAFILKSEILGGCSFEEVVYSRRGVYSRKYGTPTTQYRTATLLTKRNSEKEKKNRKKGN